MWVVARVGNSLSALLVDAVLSNPFGVGNSHYRIGDREGFVDTVPFGAYRRELFDRVGMYNERLVRNQDNDLNARIRKAGGKIYLARALTTQYHPAKNLWQLLGQTYRNSRWHFFSVRENIRAMSLRHFVPSIFVLVLTTLTVGSLFSKLSAFILSLLLVAYLAVGFCFAFSKGRTHGNMATLTLPFACLGLHIVYGVGTLAGLRYLFKSPPAQPIRAGLPVER
jgi:hypothetical protein